MSTVTEHCPWCDSVITHEKFLSVQRAIREEEKRKLAAAEKELRNRIEKEVAAKLSAQQQKLVTERQTLEAEREKVSDERRSLATMTKRQVDLAKQTAEKQRLKELAELRAILERDRDQALLKKEAGFAREREALKKKNLEMTRRIEQKTAGNIGDGAEIDLFEELRAEFPEDDITRIAKGRPGGDILHDVRYKGTSCGSILIDCKQRQAWQGAFPRKLRQDQTDAGASHAILSTTIFPAGKKELFTESGVIVASPARVIAIVELLRKAMIAMHVAKLGDAERATKLTRLYAFMTSSEFKQKMAEAGELAIEALGIDVDEQRAHANVWKKRGLALTRIKHVLREIDTDVSAIIEARDTSQLADIASLPARAMASREH